jgi:hypothetical protein
MALDKVTVGVLADEAVTSAKLDTNLQVDGTLGVTGASTLTGNATASGNLTVTGDIVPSTPLSHRNLIINGGMQVWQRATAATAAHSYVTADRWQFNEGGGSDGEFTCEKHTMALSEINTTGHSTALKLVCTTLDSAVDPSTYAYFSHNIEAQNLQHLQYGTANAKTITASFWVKSNKTGSYSFNITKEDSTACRFSKSYSIDVADTWEQKKITITPDAGSTVFVTGSGGIIVNDNGLGFAVNFGLSWGSNYQTSTDGVWTTSGHYAVNTQVNWQDSTSNNFYITGVQLELGSNATPFEHRSFGDELHRCQRYFYRFPALGGGNIGGIVVQQHTAGNTYGGIRFKQTMRAAPTLSVLNPTSFSVYSGGTGRACIGIASDGTSTDGASFGFNTASATVGQAGAVNGSSGAAFTFEAEL